MRIRGLSFARRRAALAVSLAGLLLASTAAASDVTGLQQRSRALVGSERSATMELYAIGSRLQQAQDELAAVEGRVAALEAERGRVRLELRAARRTLQLAQLRLGSEVRVLYEHDQPDALAVILGSASMDELITGLDGLSRAAGATNSVLEEAKQARARVSRLSQTLGERQQALEQLEAAARGRAQALERAQAEREAYLSSLRQQARLTATQIVSAEARARAAEARSQTATLMAETSGSAASFAAQSLLPQATVPASDPPPPSARSGTLSGRQLTVLATAYSLPGSTASGLPVGPGVVAVDPTVIPLGTRMTIPGYGEGIAADVGTAIKGLRIDVWFPTLAQARAWGLRQVTITLH